MAMGTKSVKGTADVETPEDAAAADVETREEATPEAAPSVPPVEPDRVASVSYRADGTPDQTPDFVQLDVES